MGLFTPKYPKPDTPGVASSPAPRETRAVRRERERVQQQRAADAKRDQEIVRASKERTASFWQDYERRNGPGSVDWSNYSG